jgi:hypothetical protein
MNVGVVKRLRDNHVESIMYTLNEAGIREAVLEYLKKHHGFLEKGHFEWDVYMNKKGRVVFELIQSTEVE